MKQTEWEIEWEEGNTDDGRGGDGDGGGLCKRYAISNKWRNRERKRDQDWRPLGCHW